jgi:hypothetical protein
VRHVAARVSIDGAGGDAGLNSEGGGGAFPVLWCLAGVVIIGVNLWAAFARNGSLATFERDDRPSR